MYNDYRASITHNQSGEHSHVAASFVKRTLSFTWPKMSEKNTNSKIIITSNPISYLSPKGRKLSQTRGNRLVSKGGRVNLRSSNVPQKRERFLADFFTSLIDAKWRWVIGLYSTGFIFSWSFFGTAWFVIHILRTNYDDGKICVDNVFSWTSAFLFSVETQTTIGYGGRQVKQLNCFLLALHWVGATYLCSPFVGLSVKLFYKHFIGFVSVLQFSALCWVFCHII